MINDKIKNLFVFGTRPEAIKMAPVITAFKECDQFFETKVCVTAQHREMLDQVLSFFGIVPDFDLNLMTPNQTLNRITGEALLLLDDILKEYDPDNVFVHGDTTTSMAASLASFNRGIKVSHIEAGLRTYNKYSPYPEEINRQITSKIADFHFSPTLNAKSNLLKEGIDPESIVVTGNTVIDALFFSQTKLVDYESAQVEELKRQLDFSKQIILVTGHRRENHGSGFLSICSALDRVSKLDNITIIYPVHMNPNVKGPVYERLGDNPNIILIPPLSYPDFVWLMSKSKIILTDSGGVQEEAPSLGVPVLVMRDTTERPEAVDAGTVVLVGSDQDRIFNTCKALLDDLNLYEEMASVKNPYGDGHASGRILDFFLKKYGIGEVKLVNA
ncbi:non-hydrolyzing UDP-N-acetylglucosamine 2-epimerase [Pararcticibacter amylolyticus]|uniref:UDP-N-acetylglucosamine 2-epimerase (non-hydrolyzing) n=1 Tax=Pararcticibacter amylolyticus TaxID=2173175 RepID=A0A2U2PHZ8_9SPHI|nr:UDP-N-acetylglucosamine 2-epimerase (non-hydrolyzing) [Pararcticibacter amylolyticus]PWG81036.1 UDP-N-acetylglucosamine 2-epimerase (non-hydrolyzing) [Pararcticibacter amylolyticus]